MSSFFVEERIGMDLQTQQNISGAIIFLEEHCHGDYCISHNRIIYNHNLRIPDIDGISSVNLSVVDVKGIVMVSSRNKLKFEYLPYAEGFYGLSPENLSFDGNAKISRKKLEERGFSKKFCREISHRQFFNFLNRIPRCFRMLSRVRA